MLRVLLAQLFFVAAFARDRLCIGGLHALERGVHRRLHRVGGGRVRTQVGRIVQRALHDIWEYTATAWLVSDYLLMPDHLHLFCAPRDLKFTIERWMGFWKDRLAKSLPDAGKFQAGGFHHRMRGGESYAQKWQYVRENPVRDKLVERPEDWPYFGRVHEIRWSGD